MKNLTGKVIEISHDTKKQKILNTAIELFNEFGFNSVGIDRIINESNIAKATLYRYFPSKEELVAEALEKIDEAFFQNMRTSVNAATKDPKKKLLATFDYLKTWFENESFFGCPFMKATSDYCDNSTIVFKQSQSHKLKMIEYFEELANNANIDDPKQLAEKINMLHEGATALAFISGKSMPADLAKNAAICLMKNNN